MEKVHRLTKQNILAPGKSLRVCCCFNFCMLPCLVVSSLLFQHYDIEFATLLYSQFVKRQGMVYTPFTVKFCYWIRYTPVPRDLPACYCRKSNMLVCNFRCLTLSRFGPFYYQVVSFFMWGTLMAFVRVINFFPPTLFLPDKGDFLKKEETEEEKNVLLVFIDLLSCHAFLLNQ